MIADFWLNGSFGDFYNEIDIFEITSGHLCYLTTHTRNEGEVEQLSQGKRLFSLNNSFFSDDMNTYAVRWNPNAIIYYLNNKIVRIVKNGIPKHHMFTYINIETFFNNLRIDRGYSADLLDTPEEEVTYSVDYFRYYQNSSFLNGLKADAFFRINDKISTNINNPVQCYLNSDIILNCIESYSGLSSPKYEIKIKDLTTPREYMRQLTSNEINSLEKINLRNFVYGTNVPILINHKYEITFFAYYNTGGSLNHKQYLIVKDDNVAPNNLDILNFSINDSFDSFNIFTYVPINNGYDMQRDEYGKFQTSLYPYFGQETLNGYPLIVLKNTDICNINRNFFMYIESGSQGSFDGGILTSSEINKIRQGIFDLRDFARRFGISLNYNITYYIYLTDYSMIKPGSHGNSVMKSFRVTKPSNETDFSINGKFSSTSASEPIIIDGERNCYMNSCDDICVYDRPLKSPQIYLEGYKSNTDYLIEAPFYISVQLSDINWNRYGEEKIKWINAKEVRRYDLRTLELDLENGKYYRIVLGTGVPWEATCKLIYLPNIEVHPYFTINGDHQATYAPKEVNLDSIYLSVWGSENLVDLFTYSSPFTSSTPYGHKYWLSLMEVASDGYTPLGNSCGGWLDERYLNHLGFFSDKSDKNLGENLGWLDLVEYADKLKLTLRNGKYYQVKLATDETFTSYVRYFYVNSNKLTNTNKNSTILLDSVMNSNLFVTLYPNPTRAILTIELNGKLSFMELLSSTGKVLISKKFVSEEDETTKVTYDLSYLPCGIYFLSLQSGNEVVTKKVVKL